MVHHKPSIRDFFTEKSIVRGSLHFKFNHQNWNLVRVSFYSYLVCNNVIDTKFCIWHDNSVVAVYTKKYSDLITRKRVTIIWIFQRFCIPSGNSLVTCALRNRCPSHFSLHSPHNRHLVLRQQVHTCTPVNLPGYNFKDHSGYGFDQWEEALRSNASSHWLSPYPEWSLKCVYINGHCNSWHVSIFTSTVCYACQSMLTKHTQVKTTWQQFAGDITALSFVNEGDFLLACHWSQEPQCQWVGINWDTLSWQRSGGKTLLEPMMKQFDDAHMRHPAWMNS